MYDLGLFLTGGYFFLVTDIQLFFIFYLDLRALIKEGGVNGYFGKIEPKTFYLKPESLRTVPMKI